MSIDKEEIPLEYLPEETLLSEFVTSSAAKQLIAEYKSIYNILLRTSEKQLARVNGMGKSKIKKIVYIKEVIQRIEQERKKQIHCIVRPQDAAAYCSDMQDLQQEEFRVLLLDTKNKILGQKRVFLGTVNSSLVSAREVFHAAVQNMATNIILLHNHPSGDTAPSPEDNETTKRLVKAGKILNIQVIDHIIIGKNGYYSFKQDGSIDKA
ncbi:MAG: DNA repair protein RadC [Negativicutes bacterium]|nr:DNA repair protein RadC [Negativicutes bacterium]